MQEVRRKCLWRTFVFFFFQISRQRKGIGGCWSSQLSFKGGELKKKKKTDCYLYIYRFFLILILVKGVCVREGSEIYSGV